MTTPKSQRIRERARRLRQNSTGAERQLWTHLRNRQIEGAKFRRQHPIEELITDFCCPERGIIIELDGGHHALQTGIDRVRDTRLQQAGYRVLRFWNNDVIQNTDGVLDRIRLAVIDADPHPDPLPRKERASRAGAHQPQSPFSPPGRRSG